MQTEQIVEEQADEWNDFVSRAPRGHILQTYHWGKFKGEFGWEPHFWALRDSGILKGVMLYQIRRLPLGMALAYAPRGPILLEENPDHAQELLTTVMNDARKHGASLLKVDPLVPVDDTDFWKKLLSSMGFKSSSLQIQPRHTVVTDISGTEEEILARFERTHRYNVRLSAKHGVSADINNDFDTFFSILLDTSKREHFLVHSREYFHRMFTLMNSAGLARLITAMREGKPLAAAMLFRCGKHAYYPYGGSSMEGREHKATQALQWAAMREMRLEGAKDYDFWGVPVTDKGVLAGVAAFKRGFGGKVVQYQPAMDVPLRVVQAKMFRAAIWMQIRWRNLRTHGSLTSPLGES